ncbi:hypothetical protein B0H14DRAFT_3163380 [Mycena olivaceomarginata]|nr:hypothetical protein B0H14DRAFT_3163380 [Mycena olivaceomarginata]
MLGAYSTGHGGSAAASRARRVDDLTSEEIVPAVPTPSPGADLSTALAAKAQVAFKFQGGRFLRLLVFGVSKSASSTSTSTTSRSPRSTGTRQTSARPRSAASRSHARWMEVDVRVRGVARRQGRGRGRRGGGGKLLEGAHWVVDAIHNIPTKELPCCHERGTKVFSSMGAGARSELMHVQIAGFASTVYDPLARSASLRQRLRCRSVPPGVPVVYLTEEELKKGKVGELGVLDERRVRIFAGVGELAIQNRRKLYERMLRDLQAKEAERAGTLVGRLPFDEDDVALLFEDVHRGRNVVPPHAVPVEPIVVRWDPVRALGVENVVVMEAGEAGVHESDGGEGGQGARGEDVREAVRRRVEDVERVGHVKKERRTRPRLLRGPRRLETRRHNATACFKTYTRKPAMQQHKMDVVPSPSSADAFDMIYLEQGVG